MRVLLLLLICLSFFGFELKALSVAKIFNDHAVIQRDVEVPIWGRANPGEKITLIFLGKEYKTKTNKSGKWKIVLPPIPYGGPYVFEIVGKKESITLKDIYVGDVWVCSGQSNMEFQLSASLGGEVEVSNAKDPLLRHFRIPQSSADHPSDELAGGTWYLGTPESAASFSAVGYYFAKYIRAQFPDLPIGLINNAWGGSKIEPFMSAGSFDQTQEEINDHINEIAQKTRVKQLSMLDYLDEIPEVDGGMDGDKALWADNAYNDAKWDEMKLPVSWEKAGLPSLDGIVWFRKRFSLHKLTEGDSCTLAIGRIDDDAEI